MSPGEVTDPEVVRVLGLDVLVVLGVEEVAEGLESVVGHVTGAPDPDTLGARVALAPETGRGMPLF